MFRKTLGAMLALLLPVVVCAQAVPRPKEFYFDADPVTTRPIVLVEGDDEAVQARLLRLVERGDRNAAAAAAQLAHIAMAGGRGDVGHALYARALQAGRGAQIRAVHWNYGWDLYRSGAVDQALTHWLQAYDNRLHNPEWVPPTFALALWQLDRPHEAVAWYGAAVRTWPERWMQPGDFTGLLPDWSQADRAVMAQVHAAWADNPPDWL